MSLLLTGGGCSTSLGGLVRHTGRAAALIRIPVIPERDEKSEGAGLCVWRQEVEQCAVLKLLLITGLKGGFEGS